MDQRAGAAVAGGKHCIVCGVDCAGRPRVKDPQGRYYCRPCYDSKADESAGLRDGGPASARRDADAIGLDAPAPNAALSLPHFELPPTSIEARWNRPPRGNPWQAWVEWLTGSTAAPMLRGAAMVVAALAMFGAMPDRWLTRRPSTLANTSWQSLFAISVPAALFAAIFYWSVGARWFRKRLEWCGITSLDLPEARVLYFATVVPYALFAATMTALLPLWFATPLEYREDFRAVPDLLMLVGNYVLLMLGCVALTLLVVKGLAAKPLASIMWFLVAPVLAYAAQITGGVIIGLLLANSATFSSSPADMMSPKSHAAVRDAPFAFNYPRNWAVERSGPEPGFVIATIAVSGPDGSMVVMDLAEGEDIESRPSEHLTGMLEGFREIEMTTTTMEPITRLGPFSGQGMRTTLSSKDSNRTRLEVLVVDLAPGRRLILQVFTPPEMKPAQRKGVDMVLGSLKVDGP